MKSVEEILKSELIGKTLIKTSFSDREYHKKIVNVFTAIDESREDAKVYMELEPDTPGDDNGLATAYMNEGIETL